MNNINDILNKTYQRIGSASGDTFYAQQIDGEFVIFSNGARIKLTTLLADFQPINSNGTVNESVQTVNTPDVNPDTFFNSTTPLPQVKTVDQLVEPTVVPSMIDGKPALNTPVTNQLGGLNLTEDNTQQSGLNLTNTPQAATQTNRLPEWDSFDRVKKTEDVELNVTINIRLPKARHIESINDMYETSFIAYLAKQYMADPGNIQKQIREAIEEWVEIEMNGGKPKKKKISKTIKPKKNKGLNLAPTPKTVKTEDVPIVPIGGSAASMFGQEIVKDVTKLAVIAEEEQYIAAKKYFSKLEPNHKDYYRFEGMINLWEDENTK